MIDSARWRWKDFLVRVRRSVSWLRADFVTTTDSAGANSEDLRKEAENNYREGRHNEALAKYKQILEITPGDIQALAWAGDISAALGDKDTALRYYDKLVELRPHESWPLVVRADFLAWL